MNYKCNLLVLILLGVMANTGLAYNPEDEDNDQIIFVKTKTGYLEVSFNSKITTTIEDLKEIIERVALVPVKDQQLLAGGKLLKDNYNLTKLQRERIALIGQAYLPIPKNDDFLPDNRRPMELLFIDNNPQIEAPFIGNKHKLKKSKLKSLCNCNIL
jgi:ubiquitin domain-containing protein